MTPSEHLSDSMIRSLVSRADAVILRMDDLTTSVYEERAARVEAIAKLVTKTIPRMIETHRSGCLQIRLRTLIIFLLISSGIGGTVGATGGGAILRFLLGG
jgi:predicted phage tail protein